MKSLFQLLLVLVLVPLFQACSDVSFHSPKGGGGVTNPTSCEPNCPPGTTYAWHEGGYGQCSKACGGGTQTQVVDCRRTIDDVVVADNLCSGTKPASSKSCNVQACPNPTYNWNIGAYGMCSKTCGGGVKTRTVVCQDNNGATVADSNCTPPKPDTSDTCNTDACPVVSYDWYTTHGTCSKQCGGGTEQDTVVCKKNDGTIVADSFCNAATKPATSHSCNTDPCPQVYTYAWEPGTWSACSKQCGAGLQTRSIACKRNDGAYVPENYCDAATKPAAQQACNNGSCPTTKTVTQTEYVTPALNEVDVILIIDDSSSMKEDQTKLATRLSGLIADLDALKIDYQVCLTTTDISYYKGGPIKWKTINTYVMNKATANKGTIFTTTIDALGAEWSSDEQGIKAQYLMIKDFKSSGCIRDNATLTTILVSDENERSVGGNQSWSSAQYKPLTTENYPDTLINFVKSTYNTATYKKPFIWNSIIVKPNDTVCEAKQDAQSSPSFFGTLYAELSTKTGGHIGSICDADYSNSLKIIKDKTVNSMPGITLQCTPIGNPTVTFDKAVTTTVSVTGNTLKFSPAVPEGVKVTIVYTCPL
jgi:hypothetical protein